MAHSQKRPKLTKTGGRYIANHKKRQHEVGDDPALTKIGKTHRIVKRALGGKTRTIALAVEQCIVWDPAQKKAQQSKIKSILESPANPNFVRRGIVTKGAILDTELGKARVTSRPSQTGHVQAVLLGKV